MAIGHQETREEAMQGIAHLPQVAACFEERTLACKPAGRVFEDRVTVELRLQNSGDVFEWMVGGFYEDSTDQWTASFNMPTDGGHIVDAYAASNYADSISRDYYDWYYGEDHSQATESWSSGQVGK